MRRERRPSIAPVAELVDGAVVFELHTVDLSKDEPTQQQKEAEEMDDEELDPLWSSHTSESVKIIGESLAWMKNSHR